MTTMFNSKNSIATALACGSMAACLIGVSADAQSRAERVAERRAAVEQRLQSMSQNRAERVAQRTDLLETMVNTTPEMVEERLSEVEVQILEALVAVDQDYVADRLNTLGGRAEAVLAELDLDRLTDEQVETLVAAAARAATITAEEVEALIVDGILAVDEYFDSTDPEAIAAALNEIGAEALDVQLEAQELREVLQQYAPDNPAPSEE